MSAKFLCQLLLLAVLCCRMRTIAGYDEEYITATESPGDNTTDDTDGLSNKTVTESYEDGVDESDVYSVDGSDSGKADSLADYLVNKISGLTTGDSVSEEGYTTSFPGNSALQNCSLPVYLDRYCEGIPGYVFAYFNNDVSVSGLLASLFKTDTVEALQKSCPPGSWCLSSIYHEDILHNKYDFYFTSPFCSNEMWSCIDRVQDERFPCSNDEKLDFLVNTIFLLCDLEAKGNLGEECYARTVEALYVTFADLTNPQGSRKYDLEEDDCNDYRVQMTKTYLCADDVCSFDQNLLLEKFQNWERTAKSAADVAVKCNISNTCQSDYEEDEDYYDPTTSYAYYDDAGSYYDSEYEDNEDEEYEETNQDEVDGTTGGETGQSYEEEEDEESEDYDYEEDSNEYSDNQEETNEVDVNDSNEYSDNQEETNEVDVNDSNEYSDNQEETNEDDVNADANGGYDQQDRSMMLGLVAMTGALLCCFVALVCVVYRRIRRNRNGNYKWGYSQLTSEEGKILHNDYK